MKAAIPGKQSLIAQRRNHGKGHMKNANRKYLMCAAPVFYNILSSTSWNGSNTDLPMKFDICTEAKGF